VLRISCPWCGDRDEIEFAYGGPADVALPADPEAADDTAWADFLYFRYTPDGEARERWCHSAGCRRWFVAVRDVRTNRFPPPAAPDLTPVHAAAD
jgi:heterotetrameric sarcosine oxidase delta subunit